MELKKWKLLERQECLNTKWLKVVKDIVELPTGGIVDDFYTVELCDAVLIIALDSNNNIILKKEYRHSIGETLIELPAGTFESGEIDALAVAKRELLEETGYKSDEWTFLGTTIENPAKCSNRLHIFVAKNVVKVAAQKLDDTEDIIFTLVPLNQAVEMCMNNEIVVNSSVNGIMRIARILQI